MKVCSQCKTEKSLDEFYNRKDIGCGKRNECKECCLKENKKRYLSNPEKARKASRISRQKNIEHYREYDRERNKTEYRKKLNSQSPSRKRYERKRVLNKYGITVEDYELRLEHQEYKCGICNQEEPRKRNGIKYRLCVDHNHTTGQVRHLLCSTCNRVLGLVKESPELLEKMAEYLRHFNK